MPIRTYQSYVFTGRQTYEACSLVNLVNIHFLVLAVIVLTRDNNDSTIEMDFQNNNGLIKGTHLTIERRGLRPVLSVKYLVFRIGCLT